MSYAMGFKDIFVRCSRGRSSCCCCCCGHYSYRRLQYRCDDAAAMQGKRRPPNGGAVSCIEKLSMWRHFSSALLPKRALGDDAGWVGPVIVFSSPWGLPVLSHPSLARRTKVGSAYRKAI